MLQVTTINSQRKFFVEKFGINEIIITFVV